MAPSEARMGKIPLETPKPTRPKANPNHIDATFIGYGGNPRAVDNWQAIALTAIDIFAQALKRSDW